MKIIILDEFNKHYEESRVSEEFGNETYLEHFSDFTSLDATNIYKIKGKLVNFVPIENEGKKIAKMITVIN